MIQFACLFSLLLFQCGYSYPTIGDEKQVTSIQNATSFTVSSARSLQPDITSANNKDVNTTFTIDQSSVTIGQQSNSSTYNNNNSSYREELQLFAKKVVAKVKGGFSKVKNKVKVGIGKIKTKIGDIKNNIGGGGGSGTGTGTGTSYYRRPYNRNTSSGGGNVDPTVLWVLLGLGIAGVLGTILYFMVKK